jgi:hypothetical protein
MRLPAFRNVACFYHELGLIVGLAAVFFIVALVIHSADVWLDER